MDDKCIRIIKNFIYDEIELDENVDDNAYPKINEKPNIPVRQKNKFSTDFLNLFSKLKKVIFCF